MPLLAQRFAGDPILERCLAGSFVLEAPQSGDAVRKVQQALLDLGYVLPIYGADGGFGSETGAAVVALKRLHGLPANPRVGRGTMEALDAAFAGERPDDAAGLSSAEPRILAAAEIGLKLTELVAGGSEPGAVTSSIEPIAGTDGFEQTFEHAWIVWSKPTGAVALSGAIADRYRELGGPAGYLGFPHSDQHTVGPGEVAYFGFQGSGLYAHPVYGVREVHGLVGERYWQEGGPGGYLGYPTSDETAVGPGAVSRFEFQGSGIAWHPSFGVHLVYGLIGEQYFDELGGPAGFWGFPTTDEYDAGAGDRATDFEGGTLYWSPAAGVVEFPRSEPAPERVYDRWLAAVPDAPAGAGRRPPHLTEIPVPGPVGTRADITLIYSDPLLVATPPSNDPTVVALCQDIEARRDAVGVIEGLHNVKVQQQHGGSVYLYRGYRFTSTPIPLTTTVTPEETMRLTGAVLPTGVTPDVLHRAALDLWHDLSGHEGDPAAINAYDSVNVTWGGGFAAAGQLQFLISQLFNRSPQARSIFLQVGMSVEQVDRRLMFVVVDTAKRWKLYDDDAERYIRTDRRLLSLLIRIGLGNVPAGMLFAGDVAAHNRGLRLATLDAQFITLLRHAGRLQGWSLLGPWTRALRAAVAHNQHYGCLRGGWGPYEATGGDPTKVVRAIANAHFCKPAALLASSPIRFEGAFSHGALRDAARSLPERSPGDNPKIPSIRAGGVIRRADPL